MSDQNILLDLNTDRKREIIAIDGKRYELMAMQDFQLRESQWLASKGEEISKLTKPGIKSSDGPSLTKMLDQVIGKIVRTRMPRRVLRKLTDMQKITIMTTFTSVAGIKGETARPTPQHTPSSSPGSSASTAAQ